MNSSPPFSPRHFTKRRWLLVLPGLAVALAVPLVIKWKSVSDHGGQQPVEPFRIAGNLYYVGANDVTSFQITGANSHVLIDGGFPGTTPRGNEPFSAARDPAWGKIVIRYRTGAESVDRKPLRPQRSLTQQ